MATINNNVIGRRPNKNNFNLSHERLMSGQIGKLHVVDRYPVTAGDRFDSNISFLMRFAPLSSPAMVRFNVHFHAFYVPYRIITSRTSTESQWERHFLSLSKGKEDVPVLPTLRGSKFVDDSWLNDYGDFGVREYIRPDQWSIGSLADDLGLRVESYDTLESYLGQGISFTVPSISLLPFLGYQKIYQDFYRRDQIEREMALPLNLEYLYVSDLSLGGYVQDESATTKGGLTKDPWIPSTLFDIKTRNYERDYFTSALPEPQFGDDVVVGDGEVRVTAGAGATLFTDDFGLIIKSSSVVGNSFGSVGGRLGDIDNLVVGSFNFLDSSVPGRIGISALEGVSSNAFTINELRLAMQLQGVREKINRGGTRYLEMMHSIYGVTVPDARLQRAQFLGGASFPVTIGEVVQTSESKTTPQGTITGKALSAGGNKLFRNKFEFTEAGQVYIIMSVTPRTSYMGGTPRDFYFQYPEDWYIPDFDHLGEEYILKGELYSPYFTSNIENISSMVRSEFGYTPRYSFYKQGHSIATGVFREQNDNWSVTREFNVEPSLNVSFIKAEKDDFDRIFEFKNLDNTPNEHFYCQIVHNLYGKRPMSKYSTPYTFY